jgi:hypothetical protein
MPPKSEQAWTRNLPFALAGAAIVGGLVLGLTGDLRDDTTPAPSAAPVDTTSEPSSVPSAPPPPPDTYQPDVTGDDIGTVVVKGASDAHALAVVADRIVWLATEGAALSSARLDGGEVTPLYVSNDDNHYGGAFAHDARGIYWSVGTIDDAAEPIHFLQADALAAKIELGPPIGKGVSPDHLVALDGKLYWSDLGNIESTEKKLAARDKRIASMTGCDDTLYWFETPFEGEGEHALIAMKIGSEPTTLQRGLPSRTRDELRCAGNKLYWAERTGEDSYAIHTTSGKLIDTGLVTSLQIAGDTLYWAELHGEDDDAVSLLRKAPRVGGDATRIGRDAGLITAIAVGAEHLYWSGKRGITRAALATR